MTTRQILGLLCVVGAAGCGGGSGPYPALPRLEAVGGSYTWTLGDTPRGEQVRALKILPSGQVLVAGNGLRRFDGTTWSDVELPPGPDLPTQPDFVRTIAAHGDGDIWLAGRRLLHFDGTSWTDQTARLPAVSDSTAEVAYDLALGPDTVWVGRWSNAVAPERALFGVLDKGAWYPAPCDPNNPPPYGMDVAPDGSLVAPGYGIFDGRAWTPWPLGAFTAYLDRDTVWATDGVRYYSANTTDGLDLIAAPAALAPFASVTTVQLATNLAGELGETPSGVEVVDVVAVPDGVLYACVLTTTAGPLSVFVRLSGSTAEILSDRFYGWRVARVAAVGNNLVVASENGAIFWGAHR